MKTEKKQVKAVKTPIKKKKTNVSINAASSITSKIPYERCYEDGGIIEIENGVYSASYRIDVPDSCQERYTSKVAYNGMEKLLDVLQGYSYRFTIRNSTMPVDEYMDTVKLPEDKEPKVNEFINSYNKLLADNVNIGHNNFRSNLYLTVLKDAEVPDDARDSFAELDEQIINAVSNIYGYKAKRLSLDERLEVLYDIYHPDADAPEFGDKVNYDGNGFSIASMKKMKMSTKDVIAPKYCEAKERNYMKIGDKFVRTLFINSIPSVINDTLLSDLISVSSNAILSVNYQPMDADFGFKTTAKLVKSNIEVKNVLIRETIEDRKAKRSQRQEQMLVENEQTYFNKAALDVFTDSFAKKQPVILTSFIVVLYSDTLEELDRDTSLLKMSASKYAVQIKPLDLQQHEGFVSALPLGSMKVDVLRTFNTERLSRVLPMSISNIFEKKVMFQGLNEINDNFVLIDRSNYPIGLIAGAKSSGKTFANKREILNVLMSSNDKVVVVAPNREELGGTEYDSLVDKVGGDVIKPIYSDLFTTDKNYGLTVSNSVFKKMFLESFVAFKTSFYKKKCLPEELEEAYKMLSDEMNKLCEYTDYNKVIKEISEHPDDYPTFYHAVFEYGGYQPNDEYPSFFENGRLSVCSYNNPLEMLLQLDYLWNVAISMKKSNENIWIFVDGIDEFMYSPVTSDYLIALIEKCNVLKVPLTLTVQNAAKVCSNDVALIEFDYLLEKISYYKLLSLGVVERRKIVEKLGIPQSLVTYITDREPSEGIIITPTANIGFNDKFEDSDNEFYSSLK